MLAARDVRPITQLKNSAAEIVREVSEEGRTLLITQHGEAKAVIMSAEQYDQWRQTLALLKILALSKAEHRAGDTVSTDDALALADFPRRDRVMPGLAKLGIDQWRELITPPYRLIYTIEPDAVEVDAVLDGRRDLDALLLERLVRPREES